MSCLSEICAKGGALIQAPRFAEVSYDCLGVVLRIACFYEPSVMRISLLLMLT